MKLTFIFLTLITLPTQALQTAQAATITDSLVTNLSCQDLTRESVLTHIDRSKLSEEFHIPFQNWGANLIGQCWALSSAQRKLFYLQRIGVEGARPSKKDFHYAIDSFRGVKRKTCSSDPLQTLGGSQDCGEVSVPLKVLEMPEQEFYYSSAYVSWFETNAKPFKQAIEEAQQRRFYNLGAIGFATASTQPSRSASQKTMQAILKSYQRGGMPMVILRMNTMTQHVVLIKEITGQANGTYTFRIYDSNSPYGDLEMKFQNGFFFAPSSIGLFNPAQSDRPVDVALVDESEMEEIRSSVFQYYKKKCQSALSALSAR